MLVYIGAGIPVETFQFDQRYIAGIRNRDSEIESHFVAYFKMPVWLKARRQLRAPDMAEDAVQETLLRVLRYFRSGKSLELPARLPAFIQSICHNVTLEMLRAKSRYRQVPENKRDPVDPRGNLELQIRTDERKRMVREILDKLPDKDRELLQLAILEDVDKRELCQRFGVNREYLRVLLFRARQRFRAELVKREAKGRAKSGGAG
jgi:RNA polymerase sigma-70 factor, ECF subfamily